MMSTSQSVGAGPTHRDYTHAEIVARFQNYIQRQKPGLQRFYKLDNLKEPANKGLAMANGLMKKTCPPEEAAALSVLALWDVVVLVGTNYPHLFLLRCVLKVLRSTLVDSSSCSRVVVLTHEI